MRDDLVRAHANRTRHISALRAPRHFPEGEERARHCAEPTCLQSIHPSTEGRARSREIDASTHAARGRPPLAASSPGPRRLTASTASARRTAPTRAAPPPVTKGPPPWDPRHERSVPDARARARGPSNLSPVKSSLPSSLRAHKRATTSTTTVRVPFRPHALLTSARATHLLLIFSFPFRLLRLVISSYNFSRYICVLFLSLSSKGAVTARSATRRNGSLQCGSVSMNCLQ